MGNTLIPKFLTYDVVRESVRVIVESLEQAMPELEIDGGLCIVVLGPSMDESAEWPNQEIRPHVLGVWHKSKETWIYPLEEIAQCKALQLWHGRNDGRTDIMPHLLFPGDTPFWGGVKRDGIVVSCSGLKPCYDRMIAGMVADMCIARAYAAWEQSDDKKQDSAFLA